MRASQWFSATLKEVPNDAELISHQLMLRAGMIRKLGSGLYTWLPLGLRVLRKVEKIIREEMNRSHAMEILMPAVQPAELWQETGRWETFGGQLLTMKDSNGRDYCFGPTHEEVITDLVRNELRSYKQLPINFYQIQTKFRDEIRPRFGVMRAREFIMKDAYSFHLSQESLQQTYDDMYNAYCRIIGRLGLRFRAVEADTGAIGGSASHEFQVLANSGEDTIFYSDQSDYAANVEQAASLKPPRGNYNNAPSMSLVNTPNQKTIEEVATYLKVPQANTVKTLFVEGHEHPLVALVLRGDDELNEIKAAKHRLVKSPLRFADESLINKTVKAPIGSLGPIKINPNIPIIVDHQALALDSFVCGANLADLRTVKEGDISPDGKGKLHACRGIEVGHVFQLGDKYADAMKAQVLNENGEEQTMLMGCYGFGVTRVVAAAIEQHHDDKGITWPASIAPFSVVIIPINGHRCPEVMAEAEKLYQTLNEQGIDVLLEDRNERVGVLFADNDLIGIPHRIVIGDRNLKNQAVEYKARCSDEAQLIPQNELLGFIKAHLPSI